jgi:hypothetical protein
MEKMRDVLKRSLGRSLEGLPDEDRLGAAWTVACGSALAGRGRVIGFTGGVVEVEVEDARWLEQFASMQAVLARELGRIAGLSVTAIHLKLRGRHR